MKMVVEMIDDETIKKYREKVIERVNHTDILVSGIICNYYFKKGAIPLGFLSNVLYQQPLSFSSRVNMLRNILKEMENKNPDEKQDIAKIRIELNKLDDMARIRNIFAHCELKIKLGTEEEYVFNPKDYKKSVDFEKEYNEFIKIDKEVNPKLFKLFEKFGGQYLK